MRLVLVLGAILAGLLNLWLIVWVVTGQVEFLLSNGFVGVAIYLIVPLFVVVSLWRGWFDY